MIILFDRALFDDKAYVSDEEFRQVLAHFGLTEEQAMRRIQSQMPLCEKEKLADRTISTDCPLEELRARMGRLYRQWLEEAQA